MGARAAVAVLSAGFMAGCQQLSSRLYFWNLFTAVYFELDGPKDNRRATTPGQFGGIGFQGMHACVLRRICTLSTDICSGRVTLYARYDGQNSQGPPSENVFNTVAEVRQTTCSLLHFIFFIFFFFCILVVCSEYKLA